MTPEASRFSCALVQYRVRLKGSMKDALFNQIRDASGLPSLPGVVVRVLELTRSDVANAADVAAALSTDAALATRVLRFVNSPMSGAVRKVASLQHAVSLLGLRGVRMMALSLSLVANDRRGLEGAGAPPVAEGFAYPRFWARSLTTAVAAKAIAKLGGGKVCVEEAFLGGLLARMGQLVLATAIPTEYGAVLSAWRQSSHELVDEERVHLGTTHLEIGARLVDYWKFPVNLCTTLAELPAAFEAAEAIGRGSSSSAPAIDVLTQVVALADLVARLASDSAERSTRRVERAQRIAERLLGAGPREWERLLEQIAREWKETLAVLNASPSDAKWLGALQNETREQLGEVVAATKRHTDGTREKEAEALLRATVDRVAGCLNRSAFDSRLVFELERARRTATPLTLLLIDLEPLGAHIERCGAAAGELLLHAAAHAVQGVVRMIDVVARFGGTELAVIAAECDAAGALRLTERIRAAMPEASVEWRGTTLRLHACIGASIALWPDRPHTAESLVAATDAQLYLARRAGGDCVRIDPGPTAVPPTAVPPTDSPPAAKTKA